MEVVNAIGRRKAAVARVYVSEGTGKITINNRDLANYFPSSILQFVVNDFGYDSKINDLISKKKEAEQLKVVSTANAERAKQDALTAEAQGKARIAGLAHAARDHAGPAEPDGHRAPRRGVVEHGPLRSAQRRNGLDERLQLHDDDARQGGR